SLKSFSIFEFQKGRMIEDKIKRKLRSIVDFPRKGVIFRDITPILQDPQLCSEILEEMILSLRKIEFDVVAGVESRGLLFGFLLANRLQKPFIMIRKEGKLPFDKLSQEYNLEYGKTSIEIHADSIEKGQRVLIHDDLLATGGTVSAATQLVNKLGGIVSAFSFIVELDYLGGRENLKKATPNIISLVRYQE